MRRMAQLAWTSLALLVVQNVLGMDLNLFIDLPATGSFDAIVGSAPVLLVHVVNGVALLAIGGVLVAYAVRLRHRMLLAASAVNEASLLLAIYFGVHFVIDGQDDALSFLMEVAFLGAVAAVAVILVATAARRAPAETTVGGDPA